MKDESIDGKKDKRKERDEAKAARKELKEKDK